MRNSPKVRLSSCEQHTQTRKIRSRLKSEQWEKVLLSKSKDQIGITILNRQLRSKGLLSEVFYLIITVKQILSHCNQIICKTKISG